MISYDLKAFTRDGDFAFGGRIRCEDDTEALRRLKALPIGPHRCELYRGRRKVGVRDPFLEVAAEARSFARQR